MIVNMARSKDVYFVLLCYYLKFMPVENKIFSKSLVDISLIQKPSLKWRENTENSRQRREIPSDIIDSKASPFIHSQNLTLITTSFSLSGENDNEVFVTWSGVNNETVLVLTRNRIADTIISCTLWRSSDYGTTYSRVSLPADATVTHMYSSAVNRQKMMLSDLPHQRLFITGNTGQTWTTVEPRFSPYRLLPSPSNESLVLGYDLREMKLYISEDFGFSWKLMRERVTERIFWAIEGVDENINTVHFEVQDPMGPVSYHSCIAPNCAPVRFINNIGTIDFFSLVVENEYIFVQKSTDDETALYVSYRRGPFKKAYFPHKLHPLDFNIVDTSENQVFIAVDHEEDIANLYLSDVTGQFYITSIENIVGMRYPGKFEMDLVKVQGLKGIYIVNTFNTPWNEGGVFAQKTFITFNKGGNWRLLEAPQDPHENCQQSHACELHLHLGQTNKFFHIPQVVTSAAAPGLILAHGSRGEFLDLDTHVFISRDAGLTWKPAPFLGKYYLNIMDQGTVISAVTSEMVATNQVFYSTTEGASWFSHNFTDYPMNVFGVVNEPGKLSMVSSVFGHSNASVGWTMVKMNFSSVLTRQCSEDDDFELWTPSSHIEEKGQGCILGEQLVFERRKQLTQCYYGEDYFRPSSIIPCPCHRDDFECDFGFELSEDGITCKQSDWFDDNSLPAPMCKDRRYKKSQGYRKIASDNCYDGVTEQYSSELADCPLIGPKGLQIVLEKSFIAKGTKALFRLSQESGTEDETVYIWSFGDGTDLVKEKGLDKASVMSHTYTKKGSYNISVEAKNEKGSASTVLQVRVEDQLKSVLVEIPWGARTGAPSYFNVTVLDADNTTTTVDDSSLHFAWQFENEMIGSVRHLTWQNVIKQEFTQPGRYTLTLEVFNPVSSIFYTQLVDVYEEITTVRLHFSSEINRYNSSNLNVRQALAEILCHNLAQVLEVRRSRIIMTVQPYMPVVGDVSILPAKPNTNESDTFKVAQMLISEAKQQYISFPLFTNDDIVIVTDAGILDLTSGTETTEPPPTHIKTVIVPVTTHVTTARAFAENSMLVIYIAVPIILTAVIISSLVILYYKKKFRQKSQTYSRYVRCKNDSVCEPDDVNIDATCEIIDDDLEDDLPQSELEFHLVNMTQNDSSLNLSRNF